MFYVKKKLSKGVEINVDIEYDNVYTRCPECGVRFSPKHSHNAPQFPKKIILYYTITTINFYNFTGVKRKLHQCKVIFKN